MTAVTKLAVLGAGKLGEAILGGLFEAGTLAPSEVVATAAHQARVDLVGERLGVRTTLDNRAAVAEAEAVLIAVKPPAVPKVLADVSSTLTPDQVVVTAAAAVTTAFVEELLAQPVPVVRAMPNTPCQIRQGMTALAAGRHADEGHLARAREIFDAVGRSVIVDERHLDAITGLSGSGPAFLYIVIESLAEGGVKAGLPREVATELAAQTVLGAGAMVLATGEHPARLKDMVTTPAGCTMDGILELEDGGLRVTLIKAVAQAARRAGELLDG